MAITLLNENLKEKLQAKQKEIKKQILWNNEVNKLVNEWKEVMAQTNNYNQYFQTFTLSHIEKHEYGYSCRIYCPKGMALEELENIKLKIESGLMCLFMYDIPDHKAFAMAKIIKPEKVKCNDIPFSPVKVKPWEFYAGVNIAGEPIIFDVNKTPHILIAGQQRRGKNCCMDHGVASWIYSCNEYQTELYLFQGAKNDLIKYKNCKQVKCFILGDFDELLIVLQYLKEVMLKRTVLMQPMVERLKGDNIFHYNELNPRNKLSYIYLIIDEFISIMPTDDDSKSVKEIKNSIINLLQDIGRFGGALGVNYVISNQKPIKEFCPAFLKNMSSIRISFGFDDDVCGRAVLGDTYGAYVTGLPARRAYYLCDGKCDLLFTTNIKDRIEQFIKPYFQPGHRTVFDIIKSSKVSSITEKSKDVNSVPVPKSGKVIPQDFSNVNKTKEEMLQENIKKIPGFVPYQPPKGGK